MSRLFTPVKIGNIDLAHRMVMTPMMRSRADDDGVPSKLTSEYYARRAATGLIISENVYPDAMGKGYARTPGIETEAQVAAWSRISQVVHDGGGHIFLQLTHCGRVSHPSLLPGESTPVAPSAIKPQGKIWTGDGRFDFVVPRSLETAEIISLIETYRKATRLALEAGFDGVELNSSGGNLPEQFLSSGSNVRDDRYGGSLENRVRFVLDVLKAMVSEAGSTRVGLRISPDANLNDTHDANPQETYSYLVDRLANFNLAYLHVCLFGTAFNYHGLLRPRFAGAYLVNGLDQMAAEAMVNRRPVDAAVFGGPFLISSDAADSIKQRAALTQADRFSLCTDAETSFSDDLRNQCGRC